MVAEKSSTLPSVDVSSNSNFSSQNLTGNFNSNMTNGGRIVKDGDDYLYFNEDWGEGNITNTGRIATNGTNLKYLADYVKK